MAPRPDAAPGTAFVGDLLRHALGLSAWKYLRGAHPATGAAAGEPAGPRWSLRVNPSSGNLHPTEAYVIAAGIAGSAAGVYHYAPDRHALEQRCAFEPLPWTDGSSDPDPLLVIALTSIHWREAWKYGERAFRYCQHDLGHAIAAVRIAAGLHGLHATLLPDWPQREIAALIGIDRDDDYVDSEREEPACLLVVGRERLAVDRDRLLTAVSRGRWTGKASQLSEDHVQWTFIDDVARATEDPGRARLETPLTLSVSKGELPAPTREVILQRRSAVAFDGRSSIDAERFFAMVSHVMPADRAPWDALWWEPRIHLALFVHRVADVEPGLYMLVRNPGALDRLKTACGREFLWERAHPALPLFVLHRGDCRRLAQRLSCDQEIAADGFFSLGMLADFEASLAELGASFYRHLFWESGVVGQVLYLAAEAAGARGTGIGCFYDDPVHEVLGLRDHAFQSLYHFTVGIPVEDTRLSTDPGYPWERSRF